MNGPQKFTIFFFTELDDEPIYDVNRTNEDLVFQYFFIHKYITYRVFNDTKFLNISGAKVNISFLSNFLKID